MTPSEFWKLKQEVKNGAYSYLKGELVTVAHRKSTGYPKKLTDGIIYRIESTAGEFVNVLPNDTKFGGTYATIKVHKYYIMPKALLRDKKIEALLKDEND
jgi:hypothetical protein